MTKATDLLRLAAETIEQRGKQNGYDKKEEKSAPKIAAIYNAKKGANLTPLDVWDLLICLKEARLEAILSNNSDPTDTLIDLISYNALKAEQILTEREEEQRKKQAVFEMPLNSGFIKDEAITSCKGLPSSMLNPQCGCISTRLDVKFDNESLLRAAGYNKNGKGDN
ncbi:DUF6378 domain-containing protein [Escherichia coli]|uniref:DUF6378 domain-containing protein n=1 Tax=Escherichia coli TaxID=562 RepID=UPI00201A8D77|nr:DUF6378 domain-containing protein [Escherichia coli]